MPDKIDLKALWQRGVDAVRGDAAVTRALEESPLQAPDRIIAVGKAAAAMARPVCARWPGVPCLIVTKYGHAADAPPQAQVIEAAHPVPDAASLRAGQALINAVTACGPQDHLLMLVSGGASSLAEAPAGDLTLEGLQAQTQEMLGTGADIATMNAHRRSVSRIKGGKLLANFPGARVTTLALSDVKGDALSVIGSGIGDAPDGRRFEFAAQIIASNAIARDAVAAASPVRVNDNAETLYDDVRALAPRIASALCASASGLTILGGEPVVHLPPSPGLGGRNMALALELAREIAGRSDIRILVAGTDGTDGPTDAAGALIDGSTWDSGGQAALDGADAYPWLKERGALLVTGPTGTNVMDLLIAHKG
ncbi:MAG: DUF4147 domain-containing protein [Pseudomonadota bacterium]